jgi:flagellar secretion chaperone FliS
MIYRRKGAVYALGQYRETEIATKTENASPHELVSLLYDSLLEALAVMVAMLSQGQIVGQDQHSQRARSILVALKANLDHSSGGQVSAALSEVYQASLGELSKAISAQDADKLRSLREGLLGVANSWKQIV